MFHILYKIRINGAGHENHTVGGQEHGRIAYFLGRNNVWHRTKHNDPCKAFF